MKLNKYIFKAALALLAAALLCAPAFAESYLVCEDKNGVCPKCTLKRKIECWGGIPGTAA